MVYCVINCTVSNRDEALKISKELVQKKLIACCNIIPSITSLYEWKGSLQEENEVLLIMKTRLALFDIIKKEIEKLHSYEVPEIIAIPIVNGSGNYLKWIDKQTSEKYDI